MLPKISLLDEIRKGGYETSLITTFNAYLPFYEEVVLRRLMNAGIRHNVLLMDANQYSLALEQYPPRLAGRQYTLAPIGMPGAFHPKLFFLSGKSKGLIIVGSHNMTLAGFGFNRELTNVVRISGDGDHKGIQLAAQAWQAINSWLEISSTNVPLQIRKMVGKVRDFAPWLNDVPKDDTSDEKLLVGSPGQEPLWEQLVRYMGNGRVIDVAMTGAFFDSQLIFVKRVQEDLNPSRFTIAVDPATVQMPALVKDVPGITFVKADALGVEEKSDAKAHYLHAKGLYIHPEHGDDVFVSGSANPSYPAWLTKDGFGNAEMMLARSGQQARDVAKEIGFLSLHDMPALSGDEWAEIASTWDSNENEDVGQSKITGIAVVESDKVVIDRQSVADFKQSTMVLLTADGKEIASTDGVASKSDRYEVVFPEEDLIGAHRLQCQDGEEVWALFLLHHASLVAEQARTGIQRRFKEALQSLETDSPDIGLLIDCIDKIVFSDESAVTRAINKASSRKKDTDVTIPDPGTLAVDISETRKHQSKMRLEHSSDFGYLLDALIFHLRIHEDKSVDSLDQLGRSEEEQVGADDDENADEKLSAHQRIELLEYCHKKVRLVVNRMNGQLQAYLNGKQELTAVLVRLLGVLAVFRELRRCDGRVAWVDKGKTTVPQEERLRLFEEVMLTLFEGDASLLHLESLGEAFEHSDDIARLKGLLVWLAWDCGLTLDLQKPFMENSEQQKARLKRNAMMLALAQAVQNDDVVLDEAKQSIGSLSSSEMDWLKDLRTLIEQCDAIKNRKEYIALSQGAEAQPGDIAVHKNLGNWDLRVVSSNGGHQVSLIKLNKQEESKSFIAKYLLSTGLDIRN